MPNRGHYYAACAIFSHEMEDAYASSIFQLAQLKIYPKTIFKGKFYKGTPFAYFLTLLKFCNFSENILRPPSLYFQRGVPCIFSEKWQKNKKRLPKSVKNIHREYPVNIVTFQCGFFYVNFSLVMKNSEQLFSEHFISDQSRWSSRPLVLFSLGGRTKKLFVEECF